MKKCIRWIALALMLLTLTFSNLPGKADFGDFSSDSDWGDSGSDWGSDSGWDSDWSSSSRMRTYGSSRKRSDEDPGLWPVITIVVILGCGYWFHKIDQKYIEEKARERSARPIVDHWPFELRSMSTLKQECFTPTFAELYRRMQKAWGAGDMSSLEADFTPDAFAQYKRQLDEKNERGEHAHCIVHSVVADRMGWNETQTEWRLAVRIIAVITAWDTDDQGNIISGSDTKRKQMTYAWELRKSKSVGVNVRKCPNCGASLQINAGIKCPHCETQLTAAANSWALHSIKGISQKTLN